MVEPAPLHVARPRQAGRSGQNGRTSSQLARCPGRDHNRRSRLACIHAPNRNRGHSSSVCGRIAHRSVLSPSIGRHHGRLSRSDKSAYRGRHLLCRCSFDGKGMIRFRSPKRCPGNGSSHAMLDSVRPKPGWQGCLDLPGAVIEGPVRGSDSFLPP